MNPEEKLVALKKAYADIILNTAKEAAARIMVSERKSVRLQHELNANKEHAVQMLLRLKQMMDSKTRETETNSLNQQKKIEELEAQLQEAEDIVKDLREELRDAHYELERVRKSHSKEKKSEAASSAIVYMEKSALDQINEVYNTYQEDIDGSGSDNIVEPDTAPIQEGNKLNAVVNNTYNAYRKDLDGIESNNKVEPDTAPISEKNRLKALELRSEVNKVHPENNFSQMESSYISKPNLPSIILRSKGTEPYRNRRTQRIRAFEEKLMAGELTFSNSINTVKDDANAKEAGDEEICKTSGPKANRKKGALPAVQKVKPLKRKRKVFTRNKKNAIPLSVNLSDQTLNGDQTSDISCGELNLDNNVIEPDENPLDLLSRLSEDIQDEGTLLKCTKVSERDGLLKTVGLQSGRADVDKVDVPVVSSKEVVAGTDCDPTKQPSSDRLFKYTFQRRKKQCLSYSGSNASLENKIVKEKAVAVEKLNDPMETEMSNTMAESSRDSRRVAQVARQLISLSEKKWWK